MVEISCSGLLFDLDGVLVDSTPAVARVWSKWAIAHGFDPEETVRKAHGRPSLTTVKELLPNCPDPVAENEPILRGEIEDTEGVVPLPGVCQLLDSIPEGRWALVTSCAKPLAYVRLKAAGIPVPQKMITSDDVMLVLSWSGETVELRSLIDYSRRFRIPLIAVTASAESTLGKAADVLADSVRRNRDGEFVSAQARDQAGRRHRRRQPL